MRWWIFVPTLSYHQEPLLLHQIRILLDSSLWRFSSEQTQYTPVGEHTRIPQEVWTSAAGTRTRVSSKTCGTVLH